MQLFRKKIVRGDLTMDNRAMAPIRNTLRCNERMDHTTIFPCNLPKNLKPLPQMLFVFLRNHIFPFGELGFAQMDDFVGTCNEQVYLRAFFGEILS